MRYIHPKRTIRLLSEWFHDVFFFYLLPDSWEIIYRFHKEVGYRPNLKCPESFNEKIQWIKLHDRNPLYPLLIDKYRCKNLIAEVIGDKHIISTISGGYSRFEDIPFDELPNQFVLKCNHDAASTVICKDKATFDYNKARKKLNKSLKTNYYHYNGKQWGYKDIKPCIFVEEYMQDGTKAELEDYKFMMFNGECKCLLVCTDRWAGTKMKKNFYTPEWTLLPFTRKNPYTQNETLKPKTFTKMLAIAEQLAKFVNNAFVRVDLYEINGEVYFGELTFYPGGGLEKFIPEEWDYKLGSWIDLNRGAK